MQSGEKWGIMVQMSGFVGEYLHTLDNKGRVALPVRFRETLGPRFVVARGLDKCLFVYPYDEWNSVIDKLKAIPMNQKDGRNFARYFLSGAQEVEPDKQGRVILPQNLREYAGLNKDVFILGVGSRIEIWNKEAWDDAKKDLGERFSALAESVVGI